MNGTSVTGMQSATEPQIALPPNGRNHPDQIRAPRVSPACRLGLILLACGWLAGWSTAHGQNQQGLQLGTAVQLPTFGVTIDSQGLLQVATVNDPSGRLRAERAAAARAGLRGDLARSVPARKISLRRLEAALTRELAKGGPLDETIRCLAGLQRVERIYVYPAAHDIVLVGPAGPWMEDAAGRLVGIENNAPLVLLDDLLVALRAMGKKGARNQVVLCSIDPTPEGMRRLQGIHREFPQQFSAEDQPALAKALNARAAELLGPAAVWVHGVPADSHLAQVMIEADYRMKLIAIGLEPPPVEMTTFAVAVDRPIRDFQQWWLTPNYQWIMQDAQAEALQMVGQGVQLITNRVVLGADGGLEIQEQRASRAAKTYAREFTEKYAAIAAASPVFAQLRNVVDLLIASAWLQRNNALDRIAWDGGRLWNPRELPHQVQFVPRTAPAVANTLFKGEMLLLPAGGGFSLNPALALEPEKIAADRAGELQQARARLEFPAAEQVWWWD